MEKYHKNIRLQQYDYSQPGAYFVTICTWKRRNLFGEIVNGTMKLNRWGRIANDEWVMTGLLRKEYIENKIYVVMPNHIHGIIIITKQVAEPVPVDSRGAPIELFGQPRKGTLGSVVRAYKAEVTKGLRYMGFGINKPVWQPNYYEHIIRNEHELNLIEEYIQSNPELWEIDFENPYHKLKEKLSDVAS